MSPTLFMSGVAAPDGALTSRFRGLGPVAGNREFQNHGMMDHPIHGHRHGQVIFEALAPLAQDEIAVLLHIPEGIENKRVKTVEPFQFGREAESALRRETKPSVMLFRRLVRRKPSDQVAFPLSNLKKVAEPLNQGVDRTP